jgi:hypothetical protein
MTNDAMTNTEQIADGKNAAEKSPAIVLHIGHWAFVHIGH